MKNSSALKCIKKNRSQFEKMLSVMSSEVDDLKKIQLCAQAAIFAFNNHCGILNSKVIEDYLLTVASANSLKLSIKYDSNSFLHVMSKSYLTGGHTRVCERWIEASDKTQKHSVVFTTQGNRLIPNALRKNVGERSGEVIFIEKDNYVARGLELRKIASKYQYIILHVHAYDITPLIAFGTEEFKRPVILYNHADTWFWIGVSIADLVINFRKCDMDLSINARGVSNNTILPLPIESPKKYKPDLKKLENIKQKLNIKPGYKIIMTMASSYKYMAFNGLDFVSVFTNFIKKHKKVILIAIGPSQKEERWRKAFCDTGGRMNAIGAIPNSELIEYINLTDAFVGSFPLASPTSALDVVKYKIPFFGLNVPSLDKSDVWNKSKVLSNNIDDLLLRLESFLNGNIEKEQKLLQSYIIKTHSEKAFVSKLQHIVSRFPKVHSLHAFTQDDREEITSREFFISKGLILKGRCITGQLKQFLGKIIYLYVKYFFPLKPLRKLHKYACSFGIM